VALDTEFIRELDATMAKNSVSRNKYFKMQNRLDRLKE